MSGKLLVEAGSPLMYSPEMHVANPVPLSQKADWKVFRTPSKPSVVPGKTL